MNQRISIVIPCKNEEARLPSTLLALESLNSNYEIIIVVEKSEDRTAEIAKEWSNLKPNREAICNSVCKGKGYAVKTGMLRATGEIIFFMDADLAVPLDHLEPYVAEMIKHKWDIVIANRNHKDSVLVKKQPIRRILFGRLFNLIIRCLRLTKSNDTQCGFKGFSQVAAQSIYPSLKSTGFGFDVEVLWLANKLGYKVGEMPVNWHDKAGSKVSGIKDGIKALLEISKTCK